MHTPAYPDQKKNGPNKDNLEMLLVGDHDKPMIGRQGYDPNRHQPERMPSRRGDGRPKLGSEIGDGRLVPEAVCHPDE